MACLCPRQLRLEQILDCPHAASDYEPFLFWSALTLGGLLRLYDVVLFRQLRVGRKVVPQLGLDPEAWERARDCKSRLSVISSAGAYGGRDPIRTGISQFCRPALDQLSYAPIEGAFKGSHPWVP